MDENMTKNTEEVEAEVITEESIGNIKIAPDVVATIANLTTNEIASVAQMHTTVVGGLAGILGSKKNQSKGVKVEINENKVVIDVNIIVDYGVRIPELAWEIQENVKNNVETMTGLDVEKVNIHIEGVSFEKKEKESADEEPAEIIVEETPIDTIPADGDEIE